MRYTAAYTSKGWRIYLVGNGEERDLCGAVDSAVAWAQCDILNRRLVNKNGRVLDRWVNKFPHTAGMDMTARLGSDMVSMEQHGITQAQFDQWINTAKFQRTILP